MPCEVPLLVSDPDRPSREVIACSILAGAVPADPTLDQYLDARPTDEETARAAVRPCLALDAMARFDALVNLLRGMDRLLGDRKPLAAPDDVTFWRHWGDPSLGCPR